MPAAIVPMNVPDPQWAAAMRMRAIAQKASMPRAPGTPVDPLAEALAGPQALAPPASTPPEPKKFITPNAADSSLADALLGQANAATPIETPLELMGRLAQSYTGNKIKRDDEQKKQDQFGGLLDALAGAPPSAPSAIPGQPDDPSAPVAPARPRSAAVLDWARANKAPQGLEIYMKLKAEEDKAGQQEYGFLTLPDGTLVRTSKTGTVAATGFNGAKPPEPTTLERQLQAAGLKPGTPEYQKAMLDKSGPASTSLSIDQKGETEFEKSYGKAMGDEAAGALEIGNNSVANIQKANLLERLIADVKLGKLAGPQATVGAWAQALGVDPAILGIDPKSVPTVQAIDGLANSMIMGKIGKGGFPANNFSEQDRKFILTTIPQIGDTTEAAKVKLEVSRRLDQLASDRADAWTEARAKGDSWEKFSQQWRQKMKSTDIFADLASPASSVPGQPSAQGEKPQPKTVVIDGVVIREN